jgi:FkbM family methyltransferase
VKRAARVIAVSQATASDVVEKAGIDPNRIVVVSEGPGERFRPLADRSAGFRAASRLLPRLRAEFAFYPGGMDPRKNIARLLDAYSGLPPDTRQRHQLVVSGKLSDWDRKEVDKMLAAYGVEGHVLFTGHLSDEILLLLYQSAKLTVFPSLYEGFGLPVAESIACGTAVIASGTSSIPELIEDGEALFDPHDSASIRDKLRSALEDDAFHERLRRARLHERHSWAGAASGTAAVYQSVSRNARPAERTARRIAVVASLPLEAASGTPTYDLLAALAERCSVDVFSAKAGCVMPLGVDRYHPARFDLIERARAGYDAVLSILDGGPGGSDVLAHLRARGGNVLLQTPSLVRLYAGLEAGGFADAVRLVYGVGLPPDLAAGVEVSPSAVARRGMLMGREVTSAADRVFVHSDYARTRVQLDSDAGDAQKIEFLPIAYPQLRETSEPSGLVVARVEAVGTRLRTLFEGLALVAEERQDAEFGIVIDGGGRRLQSVVLDAAGESGIASRVTMASEQEPDAWQPWLGRAAAAVELADTRSLVPSGFLVESIAAGAPTVVPDIPALGELPDAAVARIPEGATADVLAGAISRLLDDEAYSSSLRTGARAHAEEHSAAVLAERLLVSLGLKEPEEVSPAEHYASLLDLLDRRLTVFDVGTRWGFDERWEAWRDHVELIGFEPDEEECARLRRLYEGRNVRLVPLALGRASGTAELHVASDPGSSSLLRPDPDVISQRPEVARIESVATRTVEMTTLDEWMGDEGVPGIDALKLDVQGSELAILEGATHALGSVRLLEVEVEFNEMYEGQPLFGEIDRVLRNRGFVLWRLSHLVHYGVEGESTRFEVRDEQVFENRPIEFRAEGGQLYWGHAYYVPRGLAFGGETRHWRAHVSDACIAAAYGFLDLAARSLRSALESAPTTVAERLRGVLEQVAETRERVVDAG